MKTIPIGLLALGLLAGGSGLAMAQTTATYDANQLPATKGKVAEYSLTPRGDVDGLILSDGTEVHLPPYLGPQLVYAVKPGDMVTVHGLHARAIPEVQAMAVTNDATGATVTDNGPFGPPRPGHEGQPMTAQGKIKQQLHGPRGELNGVLLEDGTIVHLPPPEARRLAADLAPGHTVYVRGRGMASALGRVIGARAIGPNAGYLAEIAAPPPHHGPGHRPPPPGPNGGPGPDGGRGPAGGPGAHG